MMHKNDEESIKQEMRIKLCKALKEENMECLRTCLGTGMLDDSYFSIKDQVSNSTKYKPPQCVITYILAFKSFENKKEALSLFINNRLDLNRKLVQNVKLQASFMEIYTDYMIKLVISEINNNSNDNETLEQNIELLNQMLIAKANTNVIIETIKEEYSGDRLIAQTTTSLTLIYYILKEVKDHLKYRLINCLLTFGADPNAYSHFKKMSVNRDLQIGENVSRKLTQKTPLSYLLDRKVSSSFLQLVPSNNNNEKVKKLLSLFVKYGADINLPNLSEGDNDPKEIYLIHYCLSKENLDLLWWICRFNPILHPISDPNNFNNKIPLKDYVSKFQNIAKLEVFMNYGKLFYKESIRFYPQKVKKVLINVIISLFIKKKKMKSELFRDLQKLLAILQ